MLITHDMKKSIACWIIAVLAVLIYSLPMYFLTDWNLSNIFAIPGVLYLGYVGLRAVTRCGIFDVFAYQFANWLSSWKRGIPKKYEDAYQYKVEISEKRHDNKMVWLPWVVVGSLCLTLCIIFAFFPGLGR